MSPSELIVLLLFFPVTLHIIIPLMVLGGWMVIKLPLTLLGREKSTTLAEQAFAS